MRLPRRRQTASSKASERATVGLAALAVGTAGAVIVGEVSRLVARRRHADSARTPQSAAEAASLATLDTVQVARTGYLEAPHHETVLFNMLSGFLGSFATIRLITYTIREGRMPVGGDIVVGKTHIHHFVPGIVLAFACGGAGLATEDDRLEEVLAIGFGAGAGLTFDEAALLLDLRDVYLEPGGTAQRAGQPGGLGAALGGDTGAADAAPRRAEGRGAGADPAPGPRERRRHRVAQAAFSSGSPPIQTTWSRAGPTPTRAIGQRACSTIRSR